MTYPGYAAGPPVPPAPGYAAGPPVPPGTGYDGHPGHQPPAGGIHGQHDPARGFYGHLDPLPPAPVGRARRKKSRSFAMRLVAVVVGALVIFVVRSFLAGMDDPTVGDCVHATADGGYDVVDCGTADAQVRIVGEEEGRWTAAEVQAATGLCADFPTTVAYVWEPAYKSNTGTVYCAGPL